ncbi:hypothetical protein, partial [Burkholderia mallei]
SCCVGMGVFSITPLKNKNPHLARVCQQSDRSLRCGFFMRAAREAMRARFAPIAREASERASIRAGEARARAVTP